MEILIQIAVLLPCVILILAALMPTKNEKIISGLALGMVSAHLLLSIALAIFWALNGANAIEVKHWTFYESLNFKFMLIYNFDLTTLIFSLVGACISFIVALFSKYYMHRDQGFKRFYIKYLLFYLGYSLVIYSGNFETLFIGWELVGISSFLLIAFYRDRYLPVKNSLKIISIYRLGDICLLLCLWLLHHIFHRSITFQELAEANLVSPMLEANTTYLIFVSILIVVAMAVKSAQLPFFSWLPRAMEGPTSSSALFYGSLSVHLGVFLLIRTYPLWQDLILIKIILVSIGLLTSVIATGISKVQSTVKTQIAYSSIAQIGIMVIEITFGLHLLALLHFAGNAFLRTYQLLVSPSVLNYLIHKQYFHPVVPVASFGNNYFRKITNSFYLLCLKEFNLDYLLHRYLWLPFKFIGNKLMILDRSPIQYLILFLIIAGFAILPFLPGVDGHINSWIPTVYASLTFILVVKAFAERKDAFRAWTYVLGSHLFILVSVNMINKLPMSQIFLYLTAILFCYVIGLWCLNKVKKMDEDIDLGMYHGYIHQAPGFAFIFLLCCLGLAGLPFTPTFIGIDLLFSFIGTKQWGQIILMALGLLFIEIAVLRIYARIFLGQFKKASHPVAFRSS